MRRSNFSGKDEGDDGDLDPDLIWFLESNRVHNTNGTSIGSAIYFNTITAGLQHYVRYAEACPVSLYHRPIKFERITRRLYCMECPQYNIRLEALSYLCDCISERDALIKNEI